MARLGHLSLMAALTLAACIPNQALDKDAVRQMVEDSLTNWPGPVQVRHIYLGGDYALGVWTQGERSGDALLVRRNGRWSMMLCGMRPLRTRAVLMRAGVPDYAAETLARKIGGNEPS